MRYANLLGRVSLVVVLAAFAGVACTAADDRTAKDKEEKKVPDVVYWPTPQPVVEKMLEVAKVTKKDVVYDLGCGDGRIVVTAAKKYGCKAVGFDIDPERIKESLDNVKKNKVEDLVTSRERISSPWI